MRLRAEIWVAAYRARLEALGIAVYVARRGDATAGAVCVKLATLDGRAVAFQRTVDPLSGERAWTPLVQGPEGDVDAVLDRAAGRDPDLWIVEVEDARGRHLLDQEGLT